MSKIKEDEQIYFFLKEFHVKYIQAHENNGEYPDPIDPIRLWKFIMKIAAGSPNQLYAQTFPLISFYNSIVPDFSTNNPEFISRQIEELKTTKNVQNVVLSIKPFIRVLPFLEISSIFSVLEISINIITQNLKTHPNQIPMAFVSVFDDVVIEDFNLETFKSVVEYFKEMIDSEQKAQVIIIFAYFALDFVKIDDHLDQFVKDTIIDALESDEDIISIAGFHLLNEYSSHFQFEPDSAPPTDFLINAIFPRLLSNNDNLSRYAHEAAKSMIKCRIFQEEYAMNQILTTFDQYPVSNIDDFFSLLHVILYPVNDYQEIDYKPEMNKLKPIRSFVLDKLKNNQEPIAKAHCINVISDLMSIKKSFVKNIVMIAFDESKKLIARKKMNTYHLISSFLDGMYINYEERRAEILELIEPLSDVLSRDKPLNKKQRLDLAIDLASICRKANKAPPPVLLMFSSSSISSKVLSEVIQACCIVLDTMTFLNKKSIKTIFEKLCQHVRSSTDSKLINFFMKPMRKLLVCYKGDLPMSKMILDTIFQNLQLLVSEQIDATECSKYVCEMEKCYEDISPKIFCNFSEIILKSKIPPPGFFMPIMTAIKIQKVPKEDIENFCNGLLDILKKKKVKAIYKSACAAIETLSVVFNVIPEALNPIEPKVEAVSDFLKEIDLSELESPKMQNMIETAPYACNFILDVYANINEEININEDLLLTIFKLLPFPVEVKCNEVILKNIMKMIMKDKFSKWKIKSCRVLAAYLLLDKKDLDEFKFDPKTVEQMIFFLNKIVAESPQNFDKILKYFHNKNRDVPKLKELIQ